MRGSVSKTNSSSSSFSNASSSKNRSLFSCRPRRVGLLKGTVAFGAVRLENDELSIFADSIMTL